MTSSLTLPLSNLRAALADSMQQCRSKTLELVRSLDYETFCAQAHPDFSPIGWHLGHVAYTEALWILQRCGGYPPLMPEYHRLFAQDGLPKSDRVKLPQIDTVIEYLDIVRSKVFDYLTIAPVDQQERLWKWLLQHECQHAETMSIVLAMLEVRDAGSSLSPPLLGGFEVGARGAQTEMILIPAGSFIQGSDAIEAQDNERSPHEIYLEAYLIDRHPVTCEEYRSFIEAGGYQDPQWWTVEGWKWLKETTIEHPLYGFSKFSKMGNLGSTTHPQLSAAHSPVCGVSWYEADAYARFVGKRLPTESEWEKAAIAHNMLGEVWQWTSTWFDRYPNFESYPYPGYSQTYFDRAHRVLKGGSWATFPWAMRNSFRNWYYPHVREIFSGFRCVCSAGVRSELVVSQNVYHRVHLTYLVDRSTPSEDELHPGSDVVCGLSQTPKTLPPRYFYDDRGSQLFEQITELSEYYLTRTETEILKSCAPEIAQITGACELIELGSGNSTKTRILLDAYRSFGHPLVYCPIDISAGILESSAHSLLSDYPDLEVYGLVGTYELALEKLPQPQLPSRMIGFIGSTLGNLNAAECDNFLDQIANALRSKEYFLLGIDLHKSKAQLEAAYNDRQNVTAEFNLNMLRHLNQRFQGDFDLTQFEHVAIYNESDRQIEMHLRSLRSQAVHLKALNLIVEFAAGETILSEISRKFDLDQMKRLLSTKQLNCVQVWTDSNQAFAVLLCQRS